jgi:hypothetical protein
MGHGSARSRFAMGDVPGRLSRRALFVLGAGVAAGVLSRSGSALGGVVELSVIVHPSNASKLTGDDLGDIFRTVMRSWPGGQAIAAFELSPNTEERVLFDRGVLKLDPDEVAHFWIDRRMRGGAPPPHQVPDAGLMLRVVGKLERAIGYVPTELVNSSVRVVARVRAGGVIMATSRGSRDGRGIL